MMSNNVLPSGEFEPENSNYTPARANERALTRIEKGEVTMDAIIGRYQVNMEEARLVLKHPSGISFDLTSQEALDLLDFINIYRKAMLTLGRETDPELKRIVIVEQEKQNNN
jgi:hypothetical protein